jgi:hypothetical protein
VTGRSGTTRRELLIRGGVAAGTATLPAAILAAPAQAQETEQTDALESVVELEQAAELAYSLAAEELAGEAGDLLKDLGTHAGEHATALGEAIDQLGVEPPSASQDPASYPSLERFDEKAGEKEQLAFFIGLEEDLIAAYEETVADLEAADLSVTYAQISAAHGQAWIALKLAAGERAPTAVELPKPESA